MNLNRQRDDEINEYIVQDKFKIAFIVMFIVTLLLLFTDRMYSTIFMNLSIDITIELQKFDLTRTAWFFNNTIFYLMYIYIAIVYTLRKNQESNFSLLWGACFLIYVSGITKLMLIGYRPIFLSEKINSDYCMCTYGKPSAYSLISIGTLSLIYTDLKNNDRYKSSTRSLMKLIIVIIQLGTSFSQLYIGINSINQIILGLAIGFTTFCGIRRMNDYMLKYIIWPVFYKDRFNDKRAIFHILFHMMWTNYLLFCLWSYRYTTFDITTNNYFNFSNCKQCLINVGSNFSVETTFYTLWFNIYFGMLLGIYISKRVRFNHKGLNAEGDIAKYIQRTMLFIFTLTPLIFAFVPYFNSVIVTFIRILFLSLIVGILMTSVYFDLLDYFALTIEEVPPQDESIVDDLNKTMTVKD